MPKVQTKLFRRPGDAKKAISELRAKGFKAEEIGIVTSGKGKKEMGDVKPVAATWQKRWVSSGAYPRIQSTTISVLSV
jgi:hypothetical protein